MYLVMIRKETVVTSLHFCSTTLAETILVRLACILLTFAITRFFYSSYIIVTICHVVYIYNSLKLYLPPALYFSLCHFCTLLLLEN